MKLTWEALKAVLERYDVRQAPIGSLEAEKWLFYSPELRLPDEARQTELWLSWLLKAMEGQQGKNPLPRLLYVPISLTQSSGAIRPTSAKTTAPVAQMVNGSPSTFTTCTASPTSLRNCKS